MHVIVVESLSYKFIRVVPSDAVIKLEITILEITILEKL